MNPHADHSRSSAVRRILDANLLRTDYQTQIAMLLTLAEQLEDEILPVRQTLESVANRCDAYEVTMIELGLL